MRCLTIFRALVVRVAFASHGVIAIVRLHSVTGDARAWFLCSSLILLVVEAMVTITYKRGKEWKWFCPSVFFYLCSVVPAIWFLELHEMHKRISDNSQPLSATNSSAFEENRSGTDDTSSGGTAINLNLLLPLPLTSDLWLRVLEQFLLLMLIIGRWMLPKGDLSHEQLSQLLLVYVGTAADIVEFYEAFNEEEVKYSSLLCYVILAVWTLSLLQFTLVLTAARSRRDFSYSIPLSGGEGVAGCDPEVFGIITSICMQDLPFLFVRLTLIFKYGVVSYTNMFFTSKNTLVIIVMIYRVVVIYSEAMKDKSQRQYDNNTRKVIDEHFANNSMHVPFTTQLYTSPSHSRDRYGFARKTASVHAMNARPRAT